MATRTLPTKPGPDESVKIARGKGPAKGKRAPAAKRIRGKMRVKPAVDAEPTPARKESVIETADRRGWQEPPDQLPGPRQERSGEQYIRLRVRVADGELSIVDSHVVDGPLAQTTAFQGGYAYEVTDGDRLLHAGSIPDLGVMRSFAHPQGTPEQRGHHTYERSTYEFNARVSADALKSAPASRIAVVLYRVKERAPALAQSVQELSSAPLSVQRAREMREVGRVVGIPAAVLQSSRSTTRRRQTTAPRPAKRAAKRGSRKR